MDDPHPELRCRCVVEGTLVEVRGWDTYYDRCPAPATREDGLCDECRNDRFSTDRCGGSGRPRMLLDDPRTPCLATEVVSE